MRNRAIPSPLVLLTILAVAAAAIAFAVTRTQPPTERVIPTSAGLPSTPIKSAPTLTPKKPKHHAPAVQRGKVYVDVFNNSGIRGLAGKVAGKASGIGWQVVGADNWYGAIPATTVYYPPRLKMAARQLALDLGIKRLAPAVDPMKLDRLTLILTGP